MSRIRSQDTQPELRVRRLLHRLGYRYRLHGKALAGRPDLVFSARKKVVFVHGCFWHGHTCKLGDRLPKSNVEFWRSKLAKNRERDALVSQRLCEQGWSALTVWECSIRDLDALELELTTFLGPPTVRPKRIGSPSHSSKMAC
jgi:DNA mismatch endonuclease, patch repair protein